MIAFTHAPASSLRPSSRITSKDTAKDRSTRLAVLLAAAAAAVAKTRTSDPVAYLEQLRQRDGE
jgi:hypothetical protein